MNDYKNTNWTQDEIDFLKSNYMNYNYPTLSKIMNRSRSAIQHKITRLNLKKSLYDNKKKQFNDGYFKNIDSAEKAYWLGFISADGTINNYRSGQYGFKITLKKSDDNFLKKFLLAINASFNISYKNIKLKGKNYGTCEISFRSKKFVTDLLQYITYNKTLKLHIPDIDSEYIRHYIRGFIDGDGCFYINHNNEKKKCFEMVAYDQSILKEIQEEFSKHNITSTIYTKKNNNKKIGVYSNQSLINLHHYLYDDASIFMQRKYEKSFKILKLAS